MAERAVRVQSQRWPLTDGSGASWEPRSGELRAEWPGTKRPTQIWPGRRGHARGGIEHRAIAAEEASRAISSRRIWQ